jgi:hypothetical protein
MNERWWEIKEEYASTQTVEQVNQYMFSRKLILECLAVCRGRIGSYEYNQGRLDCVDDIKEHFGIKEE